VRIYDAPFPATKYIPPVPRRSPLSFAYFSSSVLG